MTLMKPVTRTWVNASALTYTKASTVPSDVHLFHKSLPFFNETELHALPNVIPSVSEVFLKDESTRFGLPAFKILGASYAVHRMLAQRLSLPPTSSISEIAAAAQEAQLILLTASAGNWGRAVARTAALYGVKAEIFVPSYTPVATQRLIESEGANAGVASDQIVCKPLPADKGSYDDSLEVIRSETVGRIDKLLVADIAWEGYTECASMVSQGYSTMMREVSSQLEQVFGKGTEPTHVVVSIGCGSWGQAVVDYYSSLPRAFKRPIIVAVEPEAATCLMTSLCHDQVVSIETGSTIMNGMNCGTLSSIAWKTLRRGVDVAVAVSDWECHTCVEELQKAGIDAGPCGAATLAGFRKAMRDGAVWPDESSRVVFLSTEGNREYEAPTPP